jgi:hypothetical protein
LRVIKEMGGLSNMFSMVVPPEGNTKLIETLLPFEAGLLWLAVFHLLAQLIDIQPYFEQRFALNRTARDSQIGAEVECIGSRVPGISEGEIFCRCAFAFAQEENIAVTCLPDQRSPFSPTTLLSCLQRVALNDHVTRRVRRAWQC